MTSPPQGVVLACGKRLPAGQSRQYAGRAREAVSYAQEARLFSHRNDARAAIRSQATQARDFGPKVEVAALLEDGDTIRRVVFRGTLAAIRQALPDEGTVASWVAAGVQEAVAWDFKASRRAVRWVSPDQAPKPLQMEAASRAARPYPGGSIR